MGDFSSEPYRFSDTTLYLDYGEQKYCDESDSQAAFQETFDWLQGIIVHAGQAETIAALLR